MSSVIKLMILCVHAHLPVLIKISHQPANGGYDDVCIRRGQLNFKKVMTVVVSKGAGM